MKNRNIVVFCMLLILSGCSGGGNDNTAADTGSTDGSTSDTGGEGTDDGDESSDGDNSTSDNEGDDDSGSDDNSDDNNDGDDDSGSDDDNSDNNNDGDDDSGSDDNSDENNDGDGDDNDDDSGNSSNTCTPIALGNKIYTLDENTLTDGCVNSSDAVSMVSANSSDFNLSLNYSAADDSTQAQGIYVSSSGGGLSLINPSWLPGAIEEYAIEYRYSGVVMPVVHGGGRYHISLGHDAGLQVSDLYELNLGVIGRVGGSTSNSLQAVELSWSLQGQDISTEAKAHRRDYSVDGMPPGTVYASNGSPLRHLTWMLAQDVDERLAQDYSTTKAENCDEAGFTTLRTRAQLIDATGEQGEFIVKTEHDVQYTVDLNAIHHVYTIDWDYYDDAQLTELLQVHIPALAVANGCGTGNNARIDNDYAALRQALISGSLHAETSDWSY